MSAAAGRVASKVSGAAASAKGAAKARGEAVPDSVLNKEAKKNPELYILGTIMMGAFGMVGYHFGRKPTSSSSEAPVSMAEGSMPWQTDSKGGGPDEHFKYQYHPGGDPSKPRKDAPSALNVTIIPNVTLSKVFHTCGPQLSQRAHDKVNKYGRDDY